MLTMKSPRLPSGSIFGGMTVIPVTGSRRSLPMDNGSAVRVNAILVMSCSWGHGLDVVSGQRTRSGRVFARAGKKSLRASAVMGYSASVAGIPAAGFGRPNNEGGRAASLPVWRFFCVRCMALLSLGGAMRGASRPPVPSFRSTNPHSCRPFAFGRAWGGLSHLNEGALP